MSEWATAPEINAAGEEEFWAVYMGERKGRPFKSSFQAAEFSYFLEQQQLTEEELRDRQFLEELADRWVRQQHKQRGG